MRFNSYYKVRRIVRAVFWISIFATLYLIATRIWVNDGGVCIGTILECGL